MILVFQEKIDFQEKKFDKELLESNLIGTYKIIILKHDNIDLKGIETYGKIIITEEGITIEVDIPSLSLLRGSYEKLVSEVNKNLLVCKINKGFGENFTLSINKSNNVGAFTIMNLKNSRTTSFKIKEFLN